jgi:hypothetical protein
MSIELKDDWHSERMSRCVHGKQDKKVIRKSNMVPKCGYMKPFIKRGI